MNKYLVIPAIYLLISTTTYSQKWLHTFGQYNMDEEVMDVTQAYDKGYLIDGVFGESEKNWLIKTDINGNLLWDKYFIWSDNGYLYWGYVDQDSSGNTYMSCQFSKPGIGTWPLVLKLDPCGELLWCKVFADLNYDFGSPYDMIVKDNGDIYILTQYESVEKLDQTFICYVTSEGDFQWKQSIASSTVYPLIDSRFGERLNYFNSRYIINGNCYYPNPGNPNVVYLRPFFVMLDQDFNELWALPYGISNNILGLAYNTIPINDTIYMGVGTRRFSNGGPLLNNSLLMFFNDKGVELGYHQISNEAIGPDVGSNYIYDIRRINDSLFITSANFGENTQGNPNGELVIDTAGTVYLSESRPGTRSICKLVKTFDDKYVFATSYSYPNLKYDIQLFKVNDKLEDDTIYTGTFNYDSLCPDQITSGTIDLTGSPIITDVKEMPTREEFLKNQKTVRIKASPNPSRNGNVRLTFTNLSNVNDPGLKIFNALGLKVYGCSLEKGQETREINTRNWPSGIYLVTVFNGNVPVGQAKIIIQ